MIYNFYPFQLGAKPEHVKLGYYLGETDSCQGDSGGPLYKFVRGKDKAFCNISCDLRDHPLMMSDFFWGGQAKSDKGGR